MLLKALLLLLGGCLLVLCLPLIILRQQASRAYFVAYALDDGESTSLYRIWDDGSHPRRLTPPSPQDAFAPQWSPDGRWLAFLERQHHPEGHISVEIVRMRGDGSQRRQLTSLPRGNWLLYEWSRDGRWLLATNHSGDYRQDVYRLDPFGERVERLTDDPAQDDAPTFSPDGQWIVFSSARAGNFDIYRMRADGSDQQPVTQHPASDRAPTVSPDGRWIAFSSDRANSRDLYRLPFHAADDTQAEALVERREDEFWGIWSPDGAQMIYVSPDRGNDFYGTAHSLHLGAAHSRQLSTLRTNRSPLWSADGRWILLEARGGTLYRIDSESLVARRITDGRHFAYGAVWSPPINLPFRWGWLLAGALLALLAGGAVGGWPAGG